MTYYLLGNWKSNGTSAMVAEFSKFFKNLTGPSSETRLGLALPFHLLPASDFGADLLGAQNVSAHGEGAFTGEITGSMLASCGCTFALVGHSERRALFGETVAHTAANLKGLTQAGILPVFCIGETLEQRRAGQLKDVLVEQLAPVKDLSPGSPLVVAYEPVWAIGTGVAAQPEDVASAHNLIKGLLDLAGFGATSLLYGGSVKPGNAATLAEIDGVDGFLVGGASLKTADFQGIIQGFMQGKA